MKRIFQVVLLFGLLLVSNPLLHAQTKEIPALAPDKNVTQGELANGMRYALWPTTEESGCYYVGLLQKDSLCLCEKIQAVQKASAADSALYQVFLKVREGIQTQPQEIGTNNSILLVAGDFKKQDFINRMGPLSIVCPSAKASWEGAKIEQRNDICHRYRCLEIGDSTALISLDIFGASYSAKRLGTILPSVSARSWFMLEQILSRRLKIALAKADIPVGKIAAQHQLRTGIDNSDRFNIKLAVPAQDSTAALQEIFAVIRALRDGHASESEIECAAGKFLIEQANKDQFIESGKSKIERLCNYYLYQHELAPTSSKREFFASRKYDKNAEKQRFDRFASYYLQLPAEWGIEDKRVLAAPKINLYDSCYFALEGKKIKLTRSIKEGVTGGTLSYYENGTKSIYKKMDCKKRVYFSFVFDGGYDNLQYPEAAAYVEDVFESGRVNGYPMEDFLAIMASAGIEIRFSADFSALCLEGSCPENKVSLLMKALIALTGHFTVDEQIYPYLSRCEKTAADFFENSEDKLYATVFHQLHPDFMWSKIRPTHAPEKAVLADAAKLIRESFRDNGNSTLFLCGNIPERRIHDKLRGFMEQFHTQPRPQQRTYASMLTVSGITRQGNFDPQKNGMIVSSFDYDSGQTARIRAQIALALFQDKLSARLAPLGIRCQVQSKESIHPKENMEIIVYLSSATEEAFDIFEQCLKEMADKTVSDYDLSLAKQDYEQKYLSWQKSAFYWTELVYNRLVYGKDYHNNRSKCVKELTGASVQEFCQQWHKAGRIENIYQKWDTDQASYR